MHTIPDSRHPRVGDAAPDVMLRDENGNDVALSSLWKEGPVAFIFVRHFG